MPRREGHESGRRPSVRGPLRRAMEKVAGRKDENVATQFMELDISAADIEGFVNLVVDLGLANHAIAESATVARELIVENAPEMQEQVRYARTYVEKVLTQANDDPDVNAGLRMMMLNVAMEAYARGFLIGAHYILDDLRSTRTRRRSTPGR